MKTVRQRNDDEWSTIKDAVVVDFVHTVPEDFVRVVRQLDHTVVVVEGMIQMVVEQQTAEEAVGRPVE
jgi:hypothetical protein